MNDTHIHIHTVRVYTRMPGQARHRRWGRVSTVKYLPSHLPFQARLELLENSEVKKGDDGLGTDQNMRSRPRMRAAQCTRFIGGAHVEYDGAWNILHLPQYDRHDLAVYKTRATDRSKLGFVLISRLVIHWSEMHSNRDDNSKCRQIRDDPVLCTTRPVTPDRSNPAKHM